MDLLDFEGQDMYFHTALPDGVAELINEASENPRDPAAEAPLLKAYAMAPDSLQVLVALYRHYFYSHKMDEALEIGERAITASLKALDLGDDWRTLGDNHLTAKAGEDMPTVRFLLMALKGTGYIQMRRDALHDALDRFAKIQQFDTADRLGTTALSALARDALQQTGE